MKLPAAHIDFETRSTVDLKKQGTYVYAMHPNTDIWILSYWIEGTPRKPNRWYPGEPIPDDLAMHILSGGVLKAFNALFERLIWWGIMTPRYGWPKPALEQFSCVMAKALAMNIGGSMDYTGNALGIEHKKDMDGHRVMMQLARPRRIDENGEPVWWDDQEKITKLFNYCDQDVLAEADIDDRTFALSDMEQQVYYLDQRINDRGIYVDKAMCNRAQELTAAAARKLDDKLRRISGGLIQTLNQVAKIKTFLEYHGVFTESLAADKIEALLEDPALPAPCAQVLTLRLEGAKASAAKLDAMLRRINTDGRMRGNLQYHGASTGRWAGRGAQIQNFPRPIYETDKIEEILNVIAQGAHPDLLEDMYGPLMPLVSSCLRAMVCAQPGNVLYAADFANIEGRVLAWLAGQQDKLDAFTAYDRGEGPDLYLVAATKVYGLPLEEINKSHRMMGKVSELALGYQGGVGAFKSMAAQYGVDVGEEEADNIKVAWRESNPKIVNFWHDLERAALAAVRTPGSVQRVGKVAYRVSGSFLWCQLPSGRVLCYAYPRIQAIVTPWGATKDAVVYKGNDSRKDKKWVDIALYGGLLAENITQAVARDVMVPAMFRVEKAGYPIVFTVHDEIVSEAANDHGTLEEYQNLLKGPVPEWAAGLPVAVDGWRGQRYRK